MSVVKGRTPTDAALAPLPLPALLSQILVAFTVEFDNEAEHRRWGYVTVSPDPADLVRSRRARNG